MDGDYGDRDNQGMATIPLIWVAGLVLFGLSVCACSGIYTLVQNVLNGI